MMAVTFPDVESTIVAYLKTALASTAFPNAWVATKRAQPDEAPYPTEQVIVHVSYGPETQYVLRTATLVLDCYAQDDMTASNLGFVVESAIRGVAGNPIKRVEVVLGPVRRRDVSGEELRSLDIQLVVKGSN
jgi:hypothetical protein